MWVQVEGDEIITHFQPRFKKSVPGHERRVGNDLWQLKATCGTPTLFPWLPLIWVQVGMPSGTSLPTGTC